MSGDNQADDPFGDLDGNEETKEMIELLSCDDPPQKFQITKSQAKLCNLIQNILDGDQQAHEIEIKKVTGDILSLIVDYLKHHDGKEPAEIPKPIRSVKMDKIVDDVWDAEFINKQTKKVIFQIILGANYMDIKSLLHLGCAKIATLIKGKSPEEIKKILGDDSSNEETKHTEEDA